MMSKLSLVRADSEFVRSVATKMLRTISEPERGVALALLGVLALAAFLRFFMLSEIGIVGDDTIYYLSLARGWAEPMHDDYRLVIRAIYALVLHLADSDWSIKALNAGLDVASVLLLYGISRRMSGRLVSLATALSYALMPRAIAFSRTELLHTASTSFLLVSVAFLVATLTARSGSRGPLLPALSGLFLGLCYGIHEDLLLFAPGFVICVLLAHVEVAPTAGRGFDFHARAALTQAGALLGSVFATVSLLGFWPWFTEILSRLAKTSGRVGAADAPSAVTYPELFNNMIEFNTSAPVAFLWFATTLVAAVFGARTLWRHWKGGGPGPDPVSQIVAAEYAPAILVISYLTLYPWASPTHVFPRMFLPAVPLVMLSLFLWIGRALERVPGSGAPKAVLFGIGALALILVNFGSLHTNRDMFAKINPGQGRIYRTYNPIVIPRNVWNSFDASSYPISGYRAVFNMLKDRVDAENRLLVAPYAISSSGGERRGFRHYFGDDSVYIEDCVAGLEPYIERHSVRYIVFAIFHTVPLERSPDCYDFGDAPYSVRRERKLLNAFVMTTYEGVTHFANARHFSIVELP